MSVNFLKMPKGYEVVCPFCLTTVRFEREDCNGSDNIYCPICRNKLQIRNIAGEMSNSVKPLFLDNFDPNDPKDREKMNQVDIRSGNSKK